MLIGAGEFAARTGLTVRSIQRLCASGMVRASRVGRRGTWVIDDRELDTPSFLARRRLAPGWPRGKARGPQRRLPPAEASDSIPAAT